jgi:antitoxin Phd
MISTGKPMPTYNRRREGAMTWQLQQAEAQFAEFVDASLKEGPQVVARDGEELAVLVPIEQWKRLRSGQPSLKDIQDAASDRRPTLKDHLTAPSPTFDDMMIPERGHLRYREPPEF